MMTILLLFQQAHIRKSSRSTSKPKFLMLCSSQCANKMNERPHVLIILIVPAILSDKIMFVENGSRIQMARPMLMVSRARFAEGSPLTCFSRCSSGNKKCGDWEYFIMDATTKSTAKTLRGSFGVIYCNFHTLPSSKMKILLTRRETWCKWQWRRRKRHEQPCRGRWPP
jgi:hypothetical protein